MILLLTIILSITLISFSILRRSTVKGSSSSSVHMVTYYDSLFLNNKQKSFDLLLLWYRDLKSRLLTIEKEKEVVDPLYSKRLVSEEMYNRINEDIKNMNTERMIIEQEAQAYNRNIFKECKVRPVENKNYKIIEDIHFNKKREALESNLRERLLIK
ncbi:putative translocation protein SEC66 [Vairimorpha necatrix]|uniref:Translocation protein SEC66 n=1 Tax=Vairimorpha necatrix TaxID=6039 RepID=A0AAX4JBE1_9MICR